ncbi:MAG: SRPBCC family protein [Rhodospirillales bacterium]
MPLEYPSPLAARSPALPDLEALVAEDRVHRLIYTDPAIFEIEMQRIFGANWVYVGHESQIPAPHDFVTAKLGLRPVILSRGADGAIHLLFNRCTHRGSTVCRKAKGSAKLFQCAYHGWTYRSDGTLNSVPWPEGYAEGVNDSRFNLAQAPRVESYRGFIFATLNPEAAPVTDWLGHIREPLDDWLDRHPGGKIELCEANRLKFKGNWKLAYDNSADGYHVVFSHRSLLMTENRFNTDNKGMTYYKNRPDDGPIHVRYTGNGHHYKDKRPAMDKRPGALWESEGAHPGMEPHEAEIRAKLGDKADAALDLVSAPPMNINVFPNLLILGNHIQVLQPVSVNETDSTWYGTRIVDTENELGGTVDALNLLRMRTQESFPNFGEVDDLTNFEQIQRGLEAFEDEWVYMHRGLGIPGRVRELEDGTITGPATDEVFMRRYIREWQRLMTAEPVIALKR